MAKELTIIIGCDTDPDRESFVGKLPEDHLVWRGMLEGIPRAKERLARLKDSEGHAPVFSWCLRADHQVNTLHGAFNWVMATHKEFLLQLEAAGDELSWHPHFWRFDSAQKIWYQEYWDREFQVKMLHDAYGAYQAVLPGRAKTVRMGWGYHNNDTYRTMQQLGVEVEYSAIPGMKILPQHDNVRASNFFDWSLSPDRPYLPAESDYRREASVGEKAFSLVEIPVYVSHSLFWGVGAGLQLARKMKNLRQVWYAFTRPTFLINITGRSSYFRPMLAQIKRDLRSRGQVIFNTYLHADELIENKHPLYSLEFMEQNIASMLALARDENAKVRFIRAHDVRKYLP
jgi:hypothetical protein